MADSERMEAVKRAYAEIILNTAAESAARILSSERKALGFQQSLSVAKQEAVDMMVRLKSLMDAKIEEAETRNTLHARRIQELESQLEEAEGTILSLKTELERERTKNNDQVASFKTEEEKDENTSNNSMNSSRRDDSSCSARTGTVSPQDNTGTDLDAKVRMRNGCTQRIIAKDPKGELMISRTKKGTANNNNNNNNNRESEEINGGEEKNSSLRRGPPRRSRSKCNYVKISKFGMKIDENDEASTKKAKKGLVKCSDNIESEEQNRAETDEIELGSDFKDALIGLELIADNIAEQDEVPVTQEATQDLVTEKPKPQENITTITKPDSDKLETPVEPKTEKSVVPITELEGARSIRYTFTRKRKRVPSENNNKNSESSPLVILDENKEENNDRNKAENNDGDKEENSDGNKKKSVKKNSNEGEKRSLRLKNKSEKMLLDSPRSNRRMVQVARQLVNLSTKKW